MAYIVRLDADASPAAKRYEPRLSWSDANGRRHFKKERFRAERQAKEKKREVEAHVANGAVPEYSAGRQSFGEWAERWYWTAAATYKPSTARGYRSVLNSAVLPAFGSRRIRSIPTADV